MQKSNSLKGTEYRSDKNINKNRKKITMVLKVRNKNKAAKKEIAKEKSVKRKEYYAANK
jgi:hypothetical protein